MKDAPEGGVVEVFPEFFEREVGFEPCPLLFDGEADEEAASVGEISIALWARVVSFEGGGHPILSLCLRDESESEEGFEGDILRHAFAKPSGLGILFGVESESFAVVEVKEFVGHEDATRGSLCGGGIAEFEDDTAGSSETLIVFGIKRRGEEENGDLSWGMIWHPSGVSV